MEQNDEVGTQTVHAFYQNIADFLLPHFYDHT
jgi:hypothetical protein